MTLPEFFGCTFLAFGPSFAMFTFTIAHDPIRIIVLVAAAFVWLCALLLSSFIWFILVPLRSFTSIGLVLSVLIQVNFVQQIPNFNDSMLSHFTCNRKASDTDCIAFCGKPRAVCKRCRTIRASRRTNTFWRMCRAWDLA